MRPSVRYSRIGALVLKDFPLTKAVDIDTIDFYVDHHRNENVQVFLVLKEVVSGLREVVELHFTTDEFDKPVYRLPLNQALRLDNAQVDMALVVLDVENSTYVESDPSRVTLTTAHYKLARELAMVSELSAEAKKYYEAIVLALKEVIMKGENN